jgi:phage terminase large subunit
MSISKRWFEEQQEEDARQLRDALSDVRYASRVLHGIENTDELTMGDLCRVCRLLASAEEKLAAAVMAEEVAA